MYNTSYWGRHKINIGMGTVRLKMFDDREMLLQDMWYLPEPKWNLLSISMFDI